MDLHKKIQLLQNDHKSNIEFLEDSKQAQQEEIQRLKEENQKLRTKLLIRKKGGNSSHGAVPSRKDDKSQPEALQLAVDQARREGDELKVQTLQMEKTLDELRDQVRSLNLELSGTEVGATTSGVSSLTTDDHLQSYENQLESTMEQHQEAQSILQTYEQIIKRLKEERISFDQHLSALERTVQLKDHDLDELVLLSNDANHACEVAQQELAKRRTDYEAARAQRENVLRERQRTIQVQLRKRKQEQEQQGKQRTGQDDTSKRRHGVVNEDDEKEEEEEEEGKEEDDDDEYGERLASSKIELEALRQSCRRVKGIMGISEVEVVAKLGQQTDTMENLLTISEENQARFTALQKERESLKAQAEKRKYMPRRDKAESLQQQLVRCQEQLEQVQAKRDQLVGLLNSVKCSVLEHLYALLKKGDGRVRSAVTAAGSPKGKTHADDHDQAVLHKTLQGLETGLRDLMRKMDAMPT